MLENKFPVGRAYYVPFLTFMILMMVGELASGLFKGSGWVFREPQYWVMPAQTMICGIILAYYWRDYDFGQKLREWPRWSIGLAAGLLAFGLWIAPQLLFGAAPRLKGFDPRFFGATGLPFWLNLAFRFARLVVIVPLVEEILWRGFLMRWLVNEKFTGVPFGTFELRSFLLVALFFMLEHGSVDYPAAFLTGLLYNAVAVRTRSLGACILAHAVTNLALGLYIMRTEQWGYW